MKNLKDLFEKLNIIVEKISENAYFNNNNLKIKKYTCIIKIPYKGGFTN